MLREGDIIVFYGILIIAILMLILRTTRRKQKLLVPFLLPQRTAKKFTGEVVQLLENDGYAVISDKVKVPISIYCDEKELESRVFVDYIAEKNGNLYVVKVGKSRKPLAFNGAALREQLLPYFLLYRPQGIIYVTEDKSDLKVIRFEIEDEQPTVNFNGRSAMFWLGLGMMLAIFVIK